MGTSSSRIMGGSLSTTTSRTRPHNRRGGDRRRHRSFKRTLSSLLICGAGSSSRPRDEVEDVPPEILVRSAENCDLEKIQFLAKNPALASGNGVQYSNPRTGTRVSSSRSMFPSENSSMADDPGNSVAGDKGGSLSQNAESSHQLIANKKASPSHSLGFLVSEGEQDHRNGDVLQVDVVSVSSDNVTVGSSELTDHEARQNSRRLFWDSFSRRSSRRNADSRTFVFATDDADGLGSHDRWVLDFNSDLFDDGIRGDSRRYGSGNQITNERRWHSSSEIWERFRDVGQNETGHRTTSCPSGIHQDGTCACGSTLRAEESGPRASISRIVMLAEALFEVLDEIHRQPMSLSLSMVSVPAPESVVDSLPVKCFTKPERPESGDSTPQCYICLAEYEEEDMIRVLPCNHDFHVSCVDKWLKEIHGVCPLCRGDVRDSSVSSSGTSSL